MPSIKNDTKPESSPPPSWTVAKVTVLGLSLISILFWFASSEYTTTSNDVAGTARRLEDSFLPVSMNDDEPITVFPLSAREIVGFALAAVGLVLAAGGGIGGGGFLVPIYILIFRFAPKHAIPLSNVTVFGGAVGNTLLNVSKRHPLADRPLIDWDIIVLMEPLTVVGALLGANVSKLLPDVVIVVLLDLLLLFTAWQTFKKALQLYHKENLARDKITSSLPKDGESETAELTDGELSAPPSPEIVGGEEVKLLGDEERCDALNYGSSQEAGRELKESNELEDHIDLLSDVLAEERKVPFWNVKVMTGLFFVVLLINILKGGGSFPSPLGIKCGSFSFWMAQLSILLSAVVVSIIARNRVLEKGGLKERAKYAYLPCDVQWNKRTTCIYPALSCLSGLVAGMFGIGGGIIKAPLMLAMGVHPMVISATSACMILFTSFTATSAFAVFGLLLPEFAVVCAVMGFVTTVLGQTIMAYFLQKFERNSFIAFSIGIVVALSALGMTLESGLKILDNGPSAPCGICSSVFFLGSVI